jgi:hypothetical protein
LAYLRDAHALLLLLEEEGTADARIPRLCYDALQITVANGHQARTKVFAERAHAARVVLEGEDSPETIWLKRLPVVQLYWRGETSPSLLLFAEGSLPNPCRHLVFEEHL